MSRISSRNDSLCVNFGLTLGIGQIAAGRHIEIVQRDRIVQAGLLAERHRDVAANRSCRRSRACSCSSNGSRESTTTP